MGGGDLNLKKSWHPSTLKNQERVWKAEQQKAEEDRKMAELQRELKEEREREFLQRTAEESGAVEKKGDAKLDWMYKGPGGHVSREEYLLGRKIDTAFEQMVKMENEEGREDMGSANEAPQSSKPAYTIEHEINPESVVRRDGNIQVDMKRKLMEDPLLLIRQNEEATRRQITDNPVKMKQLQQLISAIKTKKKKRSSSSSSSSESSSSSSDSSDSEYEKRKKEKRKKRKDKKKKKKKNKKKKASESETSDSSDEERKRKLKKKEKKAKKNSEKKKSKKKEESESEQDTSTRHNRYSDREGIQTSMQKGFGRSTEKEHSPDRGCRKSFKHRDTGRGDGYVERNRELDRDREEMRRVSRDRRRERSNDFASDRRGRSRDRSRERGRRDDRYRKSRGHSRSRSRSRSRDRNSRDQERSRDGASNGHHRYGGKPKLTAKEMEKKRQEMMDAARKRDQDRKDNIQRYEEERKKEEEMEENAEKFLKSHVLSASSSSIQDRVKSRIGSLQKGGGHMDSNFLRK